MAKRSQAIDIIIVASLLSLKYKHYPGLPCAVMQRKGSYKVGENLEIGVIRWQYEGFSPKHGL
jgi:hypothetical protein